MDGQSNGVRFLALSPNGSRLATRVVDGLQVRVVTTGQLLLSLPGHAFSNVLYAAFADDDKRLAWYGSNKTVHVVELATGKQLVEFEDRGEAVVKGLVFSPDATQIASFCDNATARVWEAATGRLLFDIRYKTAGQAYNTLEALSYRRDGKCFATGGQSEMLIVWDATTGRELLALRGDNVGARRVAFNHDGTRIVSGSWDGSVKVWDATAGQELLTFKVPGPVESVGFSPDGTQVVAAGADGAMRIWDGRPLAADRPGQREALGLLQCLFRKPLLREDVIKYVSSCRTIAPRRGNWR